MALKQRHPTKHKDKVSKITHMHKKKSSNYNLWLCFIVITAFAASFVLSWCWNFYVEKKSYTRFSAVPARLKDDGYDNEQLWGTYRPGLYFGIRTKTPNSVMFGLMWFAQYPVDGKLNIRYLCEQSDNLEKYGWLQHDGRTFGTQEIVDGDFILKTDFLKQKGGKHGGDWSAHISGRKRSQESKQVVSLMFVISNEGDEHFSHSVHSNQLTEIKGRTDVLGDFKIKFKTFDNSKVIHTSYLASYEDDIYNARDAILSYLQFVKKPGKDNILGLPGDVVSKKQQQPNFYVLQITFEFPFTAEIIFESNSNSERAFSLTGDYFIREMSLRKQLFEETFEKKFKLKAKAYSFEEISFAQAALSNMIGGIGYFYGNSLIKTSQSKEPYSYFKTDLLSGVPSRSFFPRGFLWDEGFHQLLIQQWDSSITKQVLSHWLDLLNVHGWIPREQILGIEARRKVPDEFVVQHHENANPPTFFITLQMLIQNEKDSDDLVVYLKRIFPRLKGWFNWYNRTQIGKGIGTYMWHGRDAKINHELNPKTLTSGLDDYPRASHPSNDERHVDLRCWIAVAAGVLADVADIIGENSKEFRSTEKFLKDNSMLDRLHWSNKFQAYSDFGNHTPNTKLEWRIHGKHPHQQRKLIRVTKSEPALQFVNEFGYISLFPFLLKIIDPSSSKLKIILNDIVDERKLWTPYGLQSLSKKAPMYNKRNTEHDKPYWRGPIWININYLAVNALRYYSNTEGPHQIFAGEIYKKLRHNLVKNLYKQYRKTGYIWEQYDEITGRGQGCYPFTGWSGLVTLIMAEK